MTVQTNETAGVSNLLGKAEGLAAELTSHRQARSQLIAQVADVLVSQGNRTNYQTPLSVLAELMVSAAEAHEAALHHIPVKYIYLESPSRPSLLTRALLKVGLKKKPPVCVY